MTIRQPIPWRRLFAESAVIVVSILLAFSIDAWWDERQAARAQVERLWRVAAEIEINQEIIGEKISILGRAIDSTSEYLAWMGPEPESVSLDDFSRKWDDMVNIGMYTLVHRATDEYLGASSSALGDQSGIRELLLGWYAEGDRIERQYDLLRQRHSEVTDHVVSTGEPVLATMDHLPVMEAHPSSRFPTDMSRSLSDPVAENLLALYLIRLEFVARRMTAFQAYQDDLLLAIRAATESG